MELVERQFSAKCPKETKDVLDLIESLTIGLVRDSKDGLDIQEILTNLTANITKVSSAVEGASMIDDEAKAHKVEMADYAMKWGSELGKQVVTMLEARKAEGEAQA